MTSNSSDIGALQAAEEDGEDFDDGGAFVDEEIMDDASVGSSTPGSGSLTWIAWFCTLPGHEYFVEIPEDFIEDDFNLTGLNTMVPFYKEALEMVLDIEPEDSHKIPDISIIETSAELVYGLVHQRYIVTRQGLQSMHEKYQTSLFGLCPRVFCYTTPLLPCGRTDVPGNEFVRLYCPNCNDIYQPGSSRYQNIDGAFFGTTFPHLFFQTYNTDLPAPFYPPAAARSAYSPMRSPQSSQGASGKDQAVAFTNPDPYGGQKLPSARVYTPKIFGFRVSERARSGPRMRWLRARPETYEELSMVDWRGRWIHGDAYEDDEDDDQIMDDRDEPEEDDDQEDEDEDEEEEEEEEGAGEIQQPPPPNRNAKTTRRAAGVQVENDLPGNGTADVDAEDLSVISEAVAHEALQDDDVWSESSDTGYEEDDEDDEAPLAPVAPVRWGSDVRGWDWQNEDEAAITEVPELERARISPRPAATAPTLLSDSDTALDTPVEQPVEKPQTFGKASLAVQVTHPEVVAVKRYTMVDLSRANTLVL
ncbi:hypothetical protein DACRYDRAFT_19353 [Dacryopinax primogenitus]|uniref:Casein kinase II subunit beta n=1 Tax=Dacryopinax primogenitus (strain DJM 731) TaxID=1858805 RepID=M5GF74_DACPD|nr:uncharacterized protein DACRYDRAFT_19353 [Dacryopinax primogenitus]EJU06022.1 hypothetical protein DACRYDRAFT_19353 [Dacryopinax primogenitus]